MCSQRHFFPFCVLFSVCVHMASGLIIHNSHLLRNDLMENINGWCSVLSSRLSLYCEQTRKVESNESDRIFGIMNARVLGEKLFLLMLPLVTRTRGWISLFFSLARKKRVMVQFTSHISTFFSCLMALQSLVLGAGVAVGRRKKRIHYRMCARPHESSEGDFVSVPVLRCYVFFMRLCQFPLFSRPFPILQVNLWLQFSRFGSIVRLGCSKRGENAENFCWIILSGLWFFIGLFVFSLPWISPKRDPSVHFVIKNEENTNHFEKWSRVEKNVVERTNCCGNVLHLPFSLNRKRCFV